MTRHKDKIDWYQGVQRLLFSYFNSDLKLLGFSQIFKPLVHCFFLLLNDDFEHNVVTQLKAVQAEYARLFGVDIEKEDGLLLVFFVLFESSGPHRFNQDYANVAVKSKWPQSAEVRVVGLPIGNTPDESTVTKDFNFHKHTFIKNRTQTYFVGGNKQVSLVNAQSMERGQRVNLADVDCFRDTIRKSMYTHLVPHLERRFNILLWKNQEYRNSKRRNLWSFFGGDNGKPKGNANELTPPERLQFNVAEIYMMVGNYEAAGNEFKALAQQFAVS